MTDQKLWAHYRAMLAAFTQCLACTSPNITRNYETYTVTCRVCGFRTQVYRNRAPIYPSAED
jgi:hypothetical protein